MDSDDIRMVPNYFSGALATLSKEDLQLQAGFINRMAGWESGQEIQTFKRLNKVLEAPQKSSGAFVLGAVYEDMQFWAYHMDEIANIAYLEGSWEIGGFALHLQADRAKSCGKEIAGEIDSLSLGGLLKKNFGALALSIGYNQELKSSASMFSFGGGPFFTSMEEMTLDAIKSKDAKAYTLGLGYEAEPLSAGAMYGRFFADGFDTKEIDLYISHKFGNISVDGVIAFVNSRYDEDFTIFRVIARYGF